VFKDQKCAEKAIKCFNFIDNFVILTFPLAR
jgi:hypothetical protein